MINFVCICVVPQMWPVKGEQLQWRLNGSNLIYNLSAVQVWPSFLPFEWIQLWVAPTQHLIFPKTHYLRIINHVNDHLKTDDSNSTLRRSNYFIYNTAWEVSLIISDVFHNYLHFFYIREISSTGKEDLKMSILAWRSISPSVEEQRCEELNFLTFWRMKIINWQIH